MPILDPLTCGFVKVITFEVLTAKHAMQQRSDENVGQFKHRIFNKHYNRLQSIFGDAIFNVPFNTFRNKYHQIVEQIRGIAKKNVLEKSEIISVFDQKTWSQLSPEKKSLHSILDCQECLKNYKSTLAKFPVKGPLLKLKAEKYGLMKEKVLRDVTNKTISSLDRQFKENFGTTFSNQVKKMKIMENHINKKERNSADKTKVAREIVKNIEKQFNESSVER